jgi:hypothetical protein
MALVETKIADKLTYVTDARSLRLFIWKLHNAVASSIARQEEWYKRNDMALYTNRYWPSLEYEVGRVKQLNQDSMQLARLEANMPHRIGPSGADAHAAARPTT